MKKAPIVYLNGVTSTGKTSIVEALREIGATDFYYLSDDIFEDHIVYMDQEFGSEGYWKKLSEAVFLMHRTARLLSDQGKAVVIDSMLLELPAFRPHYAQVAQIYRDSPLYLVEVFCPLEICRQRNLARGDRHEYQSQEQAEVMAKEVCYHLRLDTSLLSPEQCAREICDRIPLMHK